MSEPGKQSYCQHGSSLPSMANLPKQSWGLFILEPIFSVAGLFWMAFIVSSRERERRIGLASRILICSIVATNVLLSEVSAMYDPS